MDRPKLTRSRPEELSKAELESYYKDHLIPADKKPFLTNHKKGVGAFLPTEKGGYILDGSSQIATLGLGFNPSVFFGVTHFSEAWLNRKDGEDFKLLRQNYELFFGRKLGWHRTHAFFCNAGAEANEIALGHAFNTRRNRQARQVLAFEGSFHGRMLISLSATSSPTKREPYEWPSFKSVFASWPEMKTDHSQQPRAPKGWNRAWEQASKTQFDSELQAFHGLDPLIDKEIASLLEVRKHLVAGKIFAIILEPRQCEGGDRYASFRFHNGLVNLARSFSVPVIYDEVQCGFGLSGEFFWHRLFDLRDGAGQSIGPDYVTCAKKAQLGLVLSHEPIPFPEQYAAHSFLRGYAQAIMMDQNRRRVRTLSEFVRPRLEKWVADNAKDLENPRLQGLSFSVDFKDKALLDKFVAKRFENGLLYYPAGSNTARFRLNLSYRNEDIELLFRECELVLEAARDKSLAVEPALIDSEANEELWAFHLQQAIRQLQDVRGGSSSASGKAPGDEALAFLRSTTIVKDLGLTCDWVDQNNFANFRLGIEALQKECYEETRQTPIDDFETAIFSSLGFGLVLRKDHQIAAIAFLGTLDEFAVERGTKNDPSFDDPGALYALDLTVSRKFQGWGVGQILKEAAYLGALSQGATRIQGRNRDGMAAAMLSINLSLGAYEVQHLLNDYPDLEDDRDCFYYSTRLHGTLPALKLDTAVEAAWGRDEMDAAFVERAFGGMVNKMCLSNFVSREFLEDIKFFSELLHPEMRHAYTASGQSEAVDKAIKSIWSYRKFERVLSFEGCFFGAGSFMARSLSGIGEPFFPVKHLPFPDKDNWQEVLALVDKSLAATPTHSVWIEPLCQKSLQRAPEEFLTALIACCKKHGVASVFNDSASLFYRYDRRGFAASSIFGPDVGISYVGAQMALAYCRNEFFVSKPLEIISTWDGDEYSMAAFAQTARRWQKEKSEHFALCENFEKSLREFLSDYAIEGLELKDGVGSFRGTLPQRHQSLFGRHQDKYTVIANASLMRRFVEGWKDLR